VFQRVAVRERTAVFHPVGCPVCGALREAANALVHSFSTGLYFIVCLSHSSSLCSIALLYSLHACDAGSYAVYSSYLTQR
jgi:hypothetical protein